MCRRLSMQTTLSERSLVFAHTHTVKSMRKLADATVATKSARVDPAAGPCFGEAILLALSVDSKVFIRSFGKPSQCRKHLAAVNNKESFSTRSPSKIIHGLSLDLPGILAAFRQHKLWFDNIARQRNRSKCSEKVSVPAALMPKRFQIKRQKGWKKPANGIVVSRPSKWGNPVKISKTLGREEAVAKYEKYLSDMP